MYRQSLYHFFSSRPSENSIMSLLVKLKLILSSVFRTENLSTYSDDHFECLPAISVFHFTLYQNHIFLHISTTCLLYLVLLYACPTPNFTSSFVLSIILAKAFHFPVKQFSFPLSTSKPSLASSICIFFLMGHVCLCEIHDHLKAVFKGLILLFFLI